MLTHGKGLYIYTVSAKEIKIKKKKKNLSATTTTTTTIIITLLLASL